MSRLRRNDKTAWRTYDEEGVLLDIDSGKVLGLNSTAARIWELLEHETTADELALRLIDEFSVGEDEAHADVDEFISALESRGLVQVVD